MRNLGPLHWVVGYYHSQGPLGTSTSGQGVRMHRGGAYLPHLLPSLLQMPRDSQLQRHQADQRGCPAYQPGRVPGGDKTGIEAEGGQKARQYVTPALGRFRPAIKDLIGTTGRI